MNESLPRKRSECCGYRRAKKRVTCCALDEQYLKTPQYGNRSYSTWFKRESIPARRQGAASMMKTLGIISTAPKPNKPAKPHKIYPYFSQKQGH